MKLLKIVSAIAVAVVVFFISYTYSTPQEAENLQGGSGTINQLEQWKKSGGYITQNVSGAILKLTGYESNGNCLVTDINGVVSTTTCGTGSGGDSNWTYNGSRLSPSTTVGIGVFASSTIGDGTGAGGLTVNGGATTTGNAYFGGDISMMGWNLSTSTVVCMAPEKCQFQADGVADDVTIQAAIDYATSTGGGRIYLKSATYTISSPIIMKNNFEISGDGDSTVIKPASDMDMFYMQSGSNRLSYVKIDTTNIPTYSSSVFTFDAISRPTRNYGSILFVTIHGNIDTLNGDKAIKFYDNTGTGITWIYIGNTSITGFNYGIYSETATSTAYITANKFENIQFFYTKYGIYNKRTVGQLEANTYIFNANGESAIQDIVYDEGGFNHYQSVIYDPNNLSGFAYNFASTSYNNSVTDTLLHDWTYINDEATTNKITFAGEGATKGDFYIKQGDLRIDTGANYWIGSESREGIDFDGTGNYGLTLNSKAGIGITIDADNNNTTRTFFVGHNAGDPDLSTHLFDILESGNVGIGSSTPSDTLTVVGTSTTDIFNVASSTGDSILKVAKNGFIGVNNINPDYSFDVIGNVEILGNLAMNTRGNYYIGGSQEGIRFDGSGSYASTLNSKIGGAVLIDSDNNSTAYQFFVGANSVDPDTATHLFDILETGNVGIGTTTPSRLLTVQGDGYFKNNVTAASSTFTNATSTTSFFSALGTFTNAVISTLLSVLNITITGLADIGAGVLEIPNGTAPTVDSVGELALDTTSNQLVLYGNEKKVIGNGNEYATFTYATTTAWTGTTTLPLGPAYIAETWNGIQCFTDAGTLIVQVGDGTNFTNANQSSTTVGTTNFTTNNTFTAGEKRYFRAGTPASSPTTISCTISKSLTAD